MSEIYSFQGKKYNVHETRLDDFLQKFPEAKKDNTGFIELDAPGVVKLKTWVIGKIWKIINETENQNKAVAVVTLEKILHAAKLIVKRIIINVIWIIWIFS